MSSTIQFLAVENEKFQQAVEEGRKLQILDAIKAEKIHD